MFASKTQENIIWLRFMGTRRRGRGNQASHDKSAFCEQVFEVISTRMVNVVGLLP